MHFSLLIIPTILLTFIYLVLPALLWLIDRLFRKALEQRLFAPEWNIKGIIGAILCFVADRIWIYLQ